MSSGINDSVLHIITKEGDLEQAYYIFRCLKKYDNTELVFDPAAPGINASDFER